MQILPFDSFKEEYNDGEEWQSTDPDDQSSIKIVSF